MAKASQLIVSLIPSFHQTCFSVNAAWEFFEEKRHKFQQQIKIILDLTNQEYFCNKSSWICLLAKDLQTLAVIFCNTSTIKVCAKVDWCVKIGIDL
jgi:hypothetical protein